MKNNDFYVYEWYNEDTGEIFYVGKGRGNRYKNIKNRNEYFINYYNKYKCKSRKVKEDLTEDESLEFEIELIKKYKTKGMCKCNLTEGGEGSTYEKGSKYWYIQKLSAISQMAKLSRNKRFESFYAGVYNFDNLKDKTVNELYKLLMYYYTHRDIDYCPHYYEGYCDYYEKEECIHIDSDKEWCYYKEGINSWNSLCDDEDFIEFFNFFY